MLAGIDIDKKGAAIRVGDYKLLVGDWGGALPHRDPHIDSLQNGATIHKPGEAANRHRGHPIKLVLTCSAVRAVDTWCDLNLTGFSPVFPAPVVKHEPPIGGLGGLVCVTLNGTSGPLALAAAEDFQVRRPIEPTPPPCWGDDDHHDDGGVGVGGGGDGGGGGDDADGGGDGDGGSTPHTCADNSTPHVPTTRPIQIS